MLNSGAMADLQDRRAPADAPSRMAYLRQALCSLQWLQFNRCMAAELAQGLPPEELQALFRRLGQRFAQALPVPSCASLEQLEQAFNAHWEPLRWGYVVLSEQAACLDIRHACHPLDAAFAPEGAQWAPAFFEGVYQTWLSAQGSPATLRVTAQADPASPEDGVYLILAREALP